MELTKKNKIIWSILLFGTLIGLNETVVGSFHVQYKSVILSTITLSLFAFARYKIPRIGSSLIIMLIALLFKLSSLGVQFCKPMMVILLGVGFELFASILVRKNKFSYLSFALSVIITSLAVFISFALFEKFIANNAYWLSAKFNDYVFIKAPLTAIASALLTLFGLFTIKNINLENMYSLSRKPILTQIVFGILIVSLWFVGYISMH